MSKLVSFAGFSRVAGALKFRTATDVKRIDQLRKLGDTDVVILALPNEMTKNDAIKHVLSELSSGAYMVDTVEAEALLVAGVKDENPFAKAPKAKKEVKVKVKVAKAKKSEPRELSAKELAALQFISFPVGNGAMVRYPAPKSKMSVAADEEVA